jgi:hypothetical protein
MPVTDFMRGWIERLAEQGRFVEVPAIWPGSTSDVAEHGHSDVITAPISFDYATYNEQTA